MDIVQATRSFEAWLRQQIPIVKNDLLYKHEQMRADAFLFFRATYYRWAQLWPAECPELACRPEVRAVGDLHLENFGTWRDGEGRLVWGVNDFDEASPLAFTNDLVRLAVSALLAVGDSGDFKLKPDDICPLLWDGYRECFEQGGEPFVLMERHLHLRQMAIQDLRQPVKYWPRLEAKSVPLTGDLPPGVRKAFRQSLPPGAEPEYRILKKPKGLGSLGRHRYLALARWQGGMIAREAKAVAPSAALWADGEEPSRGQGNRWLMKTARGAVRCADPTYEVRGDSLVRRLGPDCSRIDLDELVHSEDVAELLKSMGRETANIHLGTPKARKRIRAAWDHLPDGWLESAAQRMLKASLADWRLFKKKG